MDHRPGPGDQLAQRFLVLKAALHPFDRRAILRHLAGQRAHIEALALDRVEHRLADEPGPAGQRDRHSSTMWSRWTMQPRGA